MSKYRKPYYNDDTDYTTNSPSYYDSLARFSKSLKLFTDRINDVEKRFKDLVLGWLEDGTLAGLLEQVLLDDYATKDFVNQVITDLHIEDYATIEYVDQQINEFIDQVNNDLQIFKDEINNDFTDFKQEINNNIEMFKNEINGKLKHFIININEFTGSDTEKIQQALNKARDLNGGVVFVPYGKYVLNDELVIYKNTTLYSVNGTIFERNHNGYMLMNGDRGSNYRKYDGNGNIKIINGMYDGKAQDINIGKASNFVFAHADNLIIDNVTVTNANSHHIEVNSSKNVVIRNSKILGQLSSMTFVEGIQLDLATEGGLPAFGEHDNTPCKDVHIHNCYFGKSKDLPSLSRGIGTHATRIGAFMENILIENNVFDELRDFSIQFLCYKNSTIKNNTFFKCTGGIIAYSSDPDNENHAIDIYDQVTTNVQPCINITIESNYFERMNGKQILYCYGRSGSQNYDFKIINNTITNSLDVSGVIIVSNSLEVNINENLIKDVGNFPILVRGSSYIEIDKNTIRNSLNHTGIRVNDKIRNLSITNNIINKTGGNSIDVHGDVVSILVSNNLCIGSNGLNDDYYGIYIHSDGTGVVVNNNILRVLSGYNYVRAVYVTETITKGIVNGNYGDSGTGTPNFLASSITEVNNV